MGLVELIRELKNIGDRFTTYDGLQTNVECVMLHYNEQESCDIILIKTTENNYEEISNN